MKPKSGSNKLANDIVSLGKLWPYLRDSRRLIYLSAILIPSITIVQIVQPLVLKNAVDLGIMQGNFEQITYYCILFLLTVIADYLCRTGQSLSSAVVVNRMIKSLRHKLFRHVLKLKPSFHDRSMSGSLVTRATSDFDNLGESLTSGVLTSVVELFTLAGCVIGMFILSWQLGMIALFILPIVVAIVIYFSSRIKTNMLAARKKIATLNAFTQECLFASDSIKLLTAEDASNQRFRDLNKKYRDQQMKVVNYDAFLFSVLDGMSSITLGITLWFAISFMGETKPLDAGLIVAFVRYIQQLFEPLKQLGSTMAMLQGAFTAVDRIFGIMETEEFIEGNQEATLTRGSIQFKDVSFSYQASEKEPTAILRNISFALDPGQSLAIVGSTGSGKSTIIKILTKLYDHYQGSVQIDGIEIRDIEESLLRQEMAIVPQDIVLFDGSVMFNITLGNESISRDQAIEASKLVGLHQFITKFADGYDFLVKEQGSNLSQGQRQLIAFARALVRNPKIIILDEATSSIDPQAEIAIQGAMAKMMIGRSVIIIAHRLSTIEECDKILVLEQGTIVETGSHQALLAQAGPYHKLYAGLNLDSMIPSS